MAQVKRFYDEPAGRWPTQDTATSVGFSLLRWTPTTTRREVSASSGGSWPCPRACPAYVSHRFVGRHPHGRRNGFWRLLRGPHRRATERCPRAARYDPAVIIVDDDHVIRARYGLDQLDTATLVRDINLLAKEAEAKGATDGSTKAHTCFCVIRDRTSLKARDLPWQTARLRRRTTGRPEQKRPASGQAEDTMTPKGTLTILLLYAGSSSSCGATCT